jgi:hypothetical protein
MAGPASSNDALIARNVALVLGGIALVIWVAMRFFETVSVDGIDCGSGSDVATVPQSEIAACSAALDAHHHAVGFAIAAAIVFFIVAFTIHWSANRNATS